MQDTFMATYMHACGEGICNISIYEYMPALHASPDIPITIVRAADTFNWLHSSSHY